MKKMKFSKVRNVKSPIRANSTDAGIDFFVPDDFESLELNTNDSVLIPSGIKAVIPDGHALIAFNKSGIATKKKLLVGASVVDCGYEGEIHIHLINNGKEKQTINPGDKIIQFICLPINFVTPLEVPLEDLFKDQNSTRGAGGFGSTGV